MEKLIEDLMASPASDDCYALEEKHEVIIIEDDDEEKIDTEDEEEEHNVQEVGPVVSDTPPMQPIQNKYMNFMGKHPDYYQQECCYYRQYKNSCYVDNHEYYGMNYVEAEKNEEGNNEGNEKGGSGVAEERSGGESEEDENMSSGEDDQDEEMSSGGHDRKMSVVENMSSSGEEQEVDADHRCPSACSLFVDDDDDYMPVNQHEEDEDQEQEGEEIDHLEIFDIGPTLTSRLMGPLRIPPRRTKSVSF